MESPAMPLSADQVKAEFAVRRKRQFLLLVPLLGFFLLAALVGSGRIAVPEGLSPDAVQIGLFVVVAACVGYSWFNWRCPACKGYLGKGMVPKHCRNCGVALQ